MSSWAVISSRFPSSPIVVLGFHCYADDAILRAVSVLALLYLFLHPHFYYHLYPWCYKLQFDSELTKQWFTPTLYKLHL